MLTRVTLVLLSAILCVQGVSPLQRGRDYENVVSHFLEFTDTELGAVSKQLVLDAIRRTEETDGYQGVDQYYVVVKEGTNLWDLHKCLQGIQTDYPYEFGYLGGQNRAVIVTGDSAGLTETCSASVDTFFTVPTLGRIRRGVLESILAEKDATKEFDMVLNSVHGVHDMEATLSKLQTEIRADAGRRLEPADGVDEAPVSMDDVMREMMTSQSQFYAAMREETTQELLRTNQAVPLSTAALTSDRAFRERKLKARRPSVPASERSILDEDDLRKVLTVPVNRRTLVRLLAALNAQDPIRSFETKPKLYIEKPEEPPAVRDVVAKEEGEVKGRRLNQYMKPVQSNSRDTTYENSKVYKNGLLGETQIITIVDTGVNTNSCFFYDKSHSSINFSLDLEPTPDFDHRKICLYFNFADKIDSDGHGTHVAGTAGGAISADYQVDTNHNGYANKARLVVYDIGKGESLVTPSDYYNNMWTPIYNAGSRVINNSWGSVDTYTYTSSSSITDRFIWDYNDAVILFAAGNDGEKRFNTVSAPATAKNVITVGNNYNYNTEQVGYNPPYQVVSATSSRGANTSDARMLPNLCTTGHLTSAINSDTSGKIPTSEYCTIASMAGTSMATPAVAGAAAIVREYLQKGKYENREMKKPRASLIKAMLVHATVAMYGGVDGGYLTAFNAWPNPYQGFGRLHLENVLRFSNSDYNLYLYYGQLNDKKEKVTFAFDVTSANKVFKCTMAYTDMYASANAKKPLINDIDMAIKAGSEVYYPSTTGTGPDSINNVEQSTIEKPALTALLTKANPARVTVEISRRSLSTEKQPFSLVCTGVFVTSSVTTDDDISLDYEDDVPDGIIPPSGVDIGDIIFYIVIVIVVIVLVCCCCCCCKTKKSSRRPTTLPPQQQQPAPVARPAPGQPGAYPGGQPRPYPGGQPQPYPGGQPGAYPGGQQGVPVAQPVYQATPAQPGYPAPSPYPQNAYPAPNPGYQGSPYPPQASPYPAQPGYPPPQQSVQG